MRIVGTEWREHAEERTQPVSRALLRLARFHVGIGEYDFANQIETSRHWWTIDGELKTFSSDLRYVWPSELDLMASMAGMTLRERWSDWYRPPFTGESRSHISVWQKNS